jgi:DNA-directed RNA polymerase sigma subunit (sigma70/sigma32)
LARYSHPGLRGLEKQLLLSPPAVRQKHADRLESLLSSLESDREYSMEFIFFRVTGFRPTELPIETIPGDTLRTELEKMLEEVSSSAPTPVEDVPEKVYTAEDIAERYGVSERTVYRWRDRGLISRKYRFPDGRVRVGVRKEALQRFVKEHRGLVQKSGKFSPLADDEKKEIRRRAHEMGRKTDLTLTAAARRIARETGRATETIRRLLRRQQEEEAYTPFEQRRGPLEDDEKSRIYRAYQYGKSVGGLSDQFERSRSSIYRIINEQRARELLSEYSVTPPSNAPESFTPRDEEEVLHPREGADQESSLCRLHAFLKSSIAGQMEELNPKRYVSTSQLDRIESRIQVLQAIRRRLLTRALPVVFEAARKHAGPVVGMVELVDEGCHCVLEAIDRFDYQGRGSFERYARLQLMKNFARTIPEENYQAMTPSPGPGGEALDRSERIDALAHAAAHLSSLRPGPVEDETMQKVMQRFKLTTPSLRQALAPVAATLNLDDPAIRTAMERATTESGGRLQ